MDLGQVLIYVISFFGIFSGTLLLLTFFDDTYKKYSKANVPKRLPLVSIIIPAWNCEKGVERSIKNVLSLNYPKNKLDIIVVVDGNKDNTYAVASKYKKYGVRAFQIPYGGKGKALNYGISKSKGELIANLDADSFLDKNALMKMVGFFENPEVMAATPSIKVWKPKTIAQKVQALEFLASAIVKKAFSYLGSMPFASGASTMFRKEFFEKYGNYLEDSLAEDGEMSLRVTKQGYVIENAMDTAVYTSGVKSFKSLIAQRLRWFRGLLDCLIIHKSLFHPKRGNMAFVVLPMVLTSIGLTLIGATYILFKFGQAIISGAFNLSAIGFDFSHIFDFKFDAFNINIGSTMILQLLLLIFSVVLLYISKKYSKDKQRIAKPYLWFLIFYWLVAYVGWMKAAFYKVFGKKIRWGEREL